MRDQSKRIMSLHLLGYLSEDAKESLKIIGRCGRLKDDFAIAGAPRSEKKKVDVPRCSGPPKVSSGLELSDRHRMVTAPYNRSAEC